MLTIKNLTKIYKGNKIAVDNLTLTVKAGDIYGFIGHNGAGKTTTIKSVVGIHDFEQGNILIDGMDIRKEGLACKKIMAYIPDNPDLYEYLTGIQYLNFIADVYTIGKEEREAKIRKEAEDFGIYSALGDLISTYSHGMKQKLAIIGALIHEPKLLILDEPFVELDPEASLILKEKMHTLCKQGSAIFFSTHVLEVAEKLCNRIAVISHGKQIRLLTKISLCNLCGINEFRFTKDKKKKTRYCMMAVLWCILILLLISYVCSFSFGLCYLNMGNLVPAVLSMIVSIIVFLFTMFKTGPVLFDRRAYERQIALPVIVRSLIVSRFLTMYITNMLLGLLVMLPGMIMYGILKRPAVTFYLYGLIASLFLPLLPLTAASVFGAFITGISSRFKKKNLAVIVLSMLFVCAIMFGSLRMSRMDETQLSGKQWCTAAPVCCFYSLPFRFFLLSCFWKFSVIFMKKFVTCYNPVKRAATTKCRIYPQNPLETC